MTPALVVVLLGLACLGIVALVWFARSPLAGLALLPLGAGFAPRELPLQSGALNGAHLLALAGVGVVVLHLLVHPRHDDLRVRRLSAAVAVTAAAAFAAVVLASALRSPFLTVHLGVTVTTLLAIAYAASMVLAARSVADVRLLLGCLVIGSLGATAPALLQAGGVQSQLAGAVVTGRATGAFNDPNELGVYSALCVVTSVTYVATARAKWRWVAVLAGVVAVASLLLSFSRLSWIAATVGLLVLLMHRSYRRLLTRRVVPVVAVGLGVAFLLGARFPLDPLLDRLRSFSGAVNPDDQRPLIWQEAVRLFLEQPFLGWGPGAYESLTNSPRSPLWAGVGSVNHPHNGLLTVLVEQGVSGAVAVLVLVAAIGVGLVGVYRSATWAVEAATPHSRRLDRAPRAADPQLSELRTTAVLAWGLGATGITLLVNLSVDYALRNAFVMMAVWYLAGLMVAFLARAGQGTARPATSRSAPPERVERVAVAPSVGGP